MLTVALDEEERALLTVVGWMRRVDLAMIVVAICAGFHLVGALTIAVAPAAQLYTPGTTPVLEMLGLERLWALVFLAAGLAAASLLAAATPRRQLLTWYLVGPIGFIWSGRFIVTVLEGGGSAMGAIAWPTLLLLWGAAAMKIAQGSR